VKNQCNAHGSLGNYSQSQDLLERALIIQEQHYGKEHPEVAITVYHLSLAHASLGNLCRAKQLVERAFKIFVQHGHPYAEQAQRRLAEMEVKMMQISRAATVRPSVLRGFGWPC
jgi:tetratricopeptide (TPR) repeat protein